MYGYESWALTTKIRSQLQAAEMKVLRLIRGVTRLDKMRNTTIREQLGIESILYLIEVGQLRWYGHVKRMEDGRFPKQFLEWTPDGRRPVGKPRMRWTDNIATAVTSRGSTIQEIEQQELYMNRGDWKKFCRWRQDD